MAKTRLLTFSELLRHYYWCDASIDGCRGKVTLSHTDCMPYLKTRDGDYVLLHVGDILKAGRDFVLLTRDNTSDLKGVLDSIYNKQSE